MPSLKAIRRRIGSVKNTQKITKAMKLVAAARLRRATQRITELRPYATKVGEVLRAVVATVDTGSADKPVHPLLVAHEERKKAYVLLITSDRGLAGAFNSNAIRAGERRKRELLEEGFAAVEYVTVGRKGRDHLRRRSEVIAHDFTGAMEAPAKRSAEIARLLVGEFEEGVIDQLDVVFTEFKSAVTQVIEQQTLLPVALATTASDEQDAQTEYLFEPDKEALLARLLPMYVETSVYRALLDSLASEHGARMTAMDSATRNAKDMISKLTLVYNRARQAAITKELMEIIGGAEALKG
ncbi:MAG: ATP synthase F1 subunit gamma [Deltaproteobacteria bacterium]|nr:ATP synthase F1 subunit gamma [Deltaproteobacteria bacterium]